MLENVGRLIDLSWVRIEEVMRFAPAPYSQCQGRGLWKHYINLERSVPLQFYWLLNKLIILSKIPRYFWLDHWVPAAHFLFLHFSAYSLRHSERSVFGRWYIAYLGLLAMVAWKSGWADVGGGVRADVCSLEFSGESANLLSSHMSGKYLNYPLKMQWLSSGFAWTILEIEFQTLPG